MLQTIVDGVIQDGLQAIGWTVLKMVTLGRYRGFRGWDVLAEGAIGFATIAGICFVAYRWWPQ